MIKLALTVPEFTALAKSMIDKFCWRAAKLKTSDYFMQHEHPVASGKGHAAIIKRRARKRRNKK